VALPPISVDMRPTILVCEDEKLVLDMIVASLAHLDCVLIPTHSLSEARSEWASHRDGIRLAIFDYKLPDGSSAELIGEIIQGAPDVCFIVMSGYGPDQIKLPEGDRSRIHVIMKPFPLISFIRTVEKLLPGAERPAATQAALS
jgi:DNA-binding NtrC family response regulator